MKIKSVFFGNKNEAYSEKNLHDKINLIYSRPANNKGKTILAQSIFFALGNEPKFPRSFDPNRENYYIVEIESNNKVFLICRRKNNFVVRSSEGLSIFNSQSEFKRFYSKNIEELPYILIDGRKKLVDLYLYNHLFFLGQDGRDTSTLLNVAQYKNSDFINMICALAGVDFIESNDNIPELKRQIEDLSEKKKTLLLKNKILKSKKYSVHISTYSANKAEIDRKMQFLEQIKNDIKDLRNERNRNFKRISKNDLLIKELTELNKEVDEGSLKCGDCDSRNIIYSNKEFEFDVSNVDIRRHILESIQGRIDSSKDEVDRLNAQLGEKQTLLNDLLKDEDVTIENLLIHKNTILESLGADEKIKDIDENISLIKNKIESFNIKDNSNKEARSNFLDNFTNTLNEIYPQINIDGENEKVDVFTKRNEVMSGSEGGAFFIARIIAIQKILQHNHPIIIDCFRDGELSTDKEALVIEYLARTGNQVILTATFKTEEKEKYFGSEAVHLIDYSNNKNSHIMDEKFVNDLSSNLSLLGIALD